MSSCGTDGFVTLSHGMRPVGFGRENVNDSWIPRAFRLRPLASPRDDLDDFLYFSKRSPFRVN